MPKPISSHVAEPEPDIDALFSARLEALNPSGPIGVAVSGGGDSMALLDIARTWADQRNATLSVATVDHGLRPESADEAAFVARRCADWQLSHETLTITGLDGTGNLAARAREARYDRLSAWAHSLGVDLILLGHTLDDQAETVLMRLARGSGVEGLSGMADRIVWNGIPYLRPLLDVRRNALRHRLTASGIDWIEDPTNEDTSYDRVKARKAMSTLAPLGITVEGLAATADRMSRQREVLEAAAEDLAAKALTKSEGRLSLHRQHIRDALPDTAMRLLALCLMEVGCNPYRPRFRSLEPLYRRVLSPETTRATLAGCLVELTETTIIIKSERLPSEHGVHDETEDQ